MRSCCVPLVGLPRVLGKELNVRKPPAASEFETRDSEQVVERPERDSGLAEAHWQYTWQRVCHGVTLRHVCVLPPCALNVALFPPGSFTSSTLRRVSTSSFARRALQHRVPQQRYLKHTHPGDTRLKPSRVWRTSLGGNRRPISFWGIWSFWYVSPSCVSYVMFWLVAENLGRMYTGVHGAVYGSCDSVSLKREVETRIEPNREA